MNSLQRGYYAVCFAAAFIVCGVAVSLSLSVPVELADYVDNGLMLPLFRYGLLFALIAYGVVLSGEHRTVTLVIYLSVFTLGVWVGLEWVEPIVLSYPSLTDMIIRYPVLTTAMSMITGICLLLPLGTRTWLVPLVSAVSGTGLGMFILLESPFDDFYAWFSFSAGLGAIAVVLTSTVLFSIARRFLSSTTFTIAERIVGSWLIAASLLLAALAIVPLPPSQLEPLPTPDASVFDQILQE